MEPSLWNRRECSSQDKPRYLQEGTSSLDHSLFNFPAPAQVSLPYNTTLQRTEMAPPGFMRTPSVKRTARAPVFELVNGKVQPERKRAKTFLDQVRQTSEAVNAYVEQVKPAPAPDMETDAPEEAPAGDVKVEGQDSRYVSRNKLFEMTWAQKKNISSKKWNISVTVARGDDAKTPEENETAYKEGVAYLLDHLQRWSTPSYIYVGPVFQRTDRNSYSLYIALLFDSQVNYSSIVRHLGLWEEPRPEHYAVYPRPGAPFQGLLGPYGDIQETGKTIVQTGPLLVRGKEPFYCTVFGSVLNPNAYTA